MSLLSFWWRRIEIVPALTPLTHWVADKSGAQRQKGPGLGSHSRGQVESCLLVPALGSSPCPRHQAPSAFCEVLSAGLGGQLKELQHVLLIPTWWNFRGSHFCLRGLSLLIWKMERTTAIQVVVWGFHLNGSRSGLLSGGNTAPSGRKEIGSWKGRGKKILTLSLFEARYRDSKYLKIATGYVVLKVHGEGDLGKRCLKRPLRGNDSE